MPALHRSFQIILLLLTTLLLPLSSSAASRDPATHFFQESFGDLTEELEIAREGGKKGIVIFFEMDDCPFCHRMKREVLNQPEVQDYYRKHFRVISIDIEGDVELTNFKGKQTTQKAFSEKENRVRATPVIAFFDLSGNQIARFTGATRDAGEFLLLGHFVAEGHYRESNFNRFKRQQKNR
jgi:thioredoxin-related protein